MEWRPIESAPMGGLERHPAVLVYIPNAREPEFSVAVARYWGCWTTVEGDQDVEPTHWTPLPEPPKRA